MARKVTLFTGQWADLALADLAPQAKNFGYDGLELACWGDHFDVERGANDPDYCAERLELLAANGLRVATPTPGGGSRPCLAAISIR